MGIFKSYNDAKALSGDSRSIGHRAAYRGAMKIYASGGRRTRLEPLSQDEQVAFALLVLFCLALCIALVVWLV